MRIKRGHISIVILLLAVMLGIFLAANTLAYPEYTERTGEPCGACHVNPAGGGRWTARGRAWVAAGRPDYVPEVEEPTPTPGEGQVTPSPTQEVVFSCIESTPIPTQEVVSSCTD